MGESISPGTGDVDTFVPMGPPFAWDPLDFLLDIVDRFRASAVAEVTLMVVPEPAEPLCDLGLNACINVSINGVTRRCGVGTRGNSSGLGRESDGSSWIGVGGMGMVVLKRMRSHLEIIGNRSSHREGYSPAWNTLLA